MQSHGEHWSVETIELILYELRPNSHGGGYMPTRRRLYAKTCQKAVSRSDPLQGSDKNRAGRWNISVGQLVRRGLRICRVMGNTEAWKQLNWYSTNSDLTVTAEVICQHGGGYMPRLAKKQFLGRALCRGPTKIWLWLILNYFIKSCEIWFSFNPCTNESFAVSNWLPLISTGSQLFP